MKVAALTLLASNILFGASTDADIYSPENLHALTQKLAARKSGFASQPLEKYGNHYTMLAYREQTGSAEVHQTEADVFVVVEGAATIVTGGKLIGAHTEKPGEIRGTSIEGGKKQSLQTGSVVHIPAGMPHQLLVQNGAPISYFVVKVTGQ